MCEDRNYFVNIYIKYVSLLLSYLYIKCLFILLTFSFFSFVEAQQLECSGESHHSSSVPALRQPSSTFLCPAQGSSTAVRDSRSFSSSNILQAQNRAAAKKSPKLWLRRNAHVTPINGPAPQYGEWPLVGSDPLEEFSKLHDYYGQEVKKVRAEWLRGRERAEVAELIDLS